MLEFKNGIIKMSKGEQVYINLTVFNADGTIYSPVDGDEVIFSVRTLPNQSPKCRTIFTKSFDILFGVSEHFLNGVEIDSVDTKYLQTGRYFYDVIKYDAYRNTEKISQGSLFLLD